MVDRLHIVHGLLSLDVGGLERLVVNLAEAAVGEGHRVSIVCVERPGQLADEVREKGARIISLDKPAGRHPEYVERARVELEKLDADVVHTHQIGAAWYLGPAAKKLGLPVVHTEHGNQFRLISGWWPRAKMRLLIHNAARSIDRYCCVSAEIADAVTRWWSVPRGKVEVMPNGIPTQLAEDLPSREEMRKELAIPESAPIIGTVGRLTEVKEQDRLIRAARRLVGRWPDLRVLLVGDGPERARLEAAARDCGMQDRVLFLGYQSRPDRYLAAMDVFAMTSRTEGFPVSLLEAWRMGLPVVCTAVGGIPAVVTDGKDGLLVPPGDEGSIATALARILQDRDLASRLGRAGRDILRERYSLEHMVSEYEHRYRELATGLAGAR